MFEIKFMGTCEIALRWMSQNTFCDKSCFTSGNGLVPSGNKPLPEPMLTHIYITIGHPRLEWVNSCLFSVVNFLNLCVAAFVWINLILCMRFSVAISFLCRFVMSSVTKLCIKYSYSCHCNDLEVLIEKKIIYLTPKQLEMHECILSNVAIDALVLKHQGISTHSADEILLVLEQLHIEILQLWWTAWENEITFWKK